MQIIFNKDAVEKLRLNHTVLELETFNVDGQEVMAYCVVPADKIPLTEFPLLAAYIELHQSFLDGLRAKNYKLCKDITEHLLGKFGGELDTFYQEVLKRLESEN